MWHSIFSGQAEFRIYGQFAPHLLAGETDG